MVRSMTGFGRGEHHGLLKQVAVEIKTVNHRYSEILVKMPRQYSLLEEAVRKYLTDYISRGRVEVYIKMENKEKKQREVQVDKEMALAYYKALKELAVQTETTMNVRVTEIAQMPDVLKVEEPEESIDEIWQDMIPALKQAVDIVISMREAEGDKLRTDLLERMGTVLNLISKIEEKSPQVVRYYRMKLENRLEEILDKAVIDEGRLAMEIAIFADRSNIDEEIVRLHSHIGQFTQSIKKGKSMGRKLDFLLQEMNREVNTIGSKANDLEITQHVVDLKSELEKIREQVQNIE